jgi:hypothetical protein
VDESHCLGARGRSQLLVKGEAAAQPQVVARLTESGAEALNAPRDAILPVELSGFEGTSSAPLLCLAVDAPQGEYRTGDQLWLRQVSLEDAPRLINRDVLVPRAGGRFAFGRLIDRQGTLVGLLPQASASGKSWSTIPPGWRLRRCWSASSETRAPARHAGP